LLKILEKRKLVAPDHLKGQLKPPNYLIEKIDEKEYLIHREISSSEIDEYNEYSLLEYDEEMYLMGIVCTESEQEAEMAIHSYWKAVYQLNQFTEKY